MDLHVKIEIVRHYYASNASATAALRSYKREHNLKNDPFCTKTIARIIQRFEETGSVEDKPRTGRPSLQDEREQAVCDALQTTATAIGTSSTRRVSAATNIPQPSVYRILVNKMKLFPYRLRTSHAITTADMESRLQFAQWFQQQDLDFIDNIIWSDEAYFSVDGCVNTHNAIVWGKNRPEKPLTQSMFPQKVLVWMGVSATCVLRPLFNNAPGTSYSRITALSKNTVRSFHAGRGASACRQSSERFSPLSVH